MINVLLNAGILDSLIQLKVNSENSECNGMAAEDIARHFMFLDVLAELKRCSDIEKGLNQLQKAARDGEVERLEVVSNENPHILEEECENDPPLFWAVTSGVVDAVKFLVEKGADVYQKADNDDIPAGKTGGNLV